jgi:hypothetical protein
LLTVLIGSADSTIPSPLPPAKSLKSSALNDVTNIEQHPERVIVPPTEFQLHHVEPYNPLQPPSPAAISRRLQALSSESPTLASPLIDEPDSDTETSSSHQAEVDAAPLNLEHSQTPVDDHDPFQIAMQDTIKNLYKLWRLNRQDQSAVQDKDIFVVAVQHALEQL